MTADMEPNDAFKLPWVPVIPGIQLLQLIDQGELGHRYRARELSNGFLRTVRVVGTGLRPTQQGDLGRLWNTLLQTPLDPFLSTVVAHGMTADEAPWVATDGDTNGSLASQLATAGLGAAEVERIAVLTSRALQTLHENSLVHGGISPAVITREHNSWCLTDVGIAPIIFQISIEGMAAKIGEVTAHTAPEVLAGAPPTPAADVYSLGATVAEALTGRPFIQWEPGETADALLRRHVAEPPVLPPDVESKILRDFIDAACQYDPDRRPNAAALHQLIGATATGAVSADEAPPRVTDDDVQFTVYRPYLVKPERWYTMITFAHKTEASDPDFGPLDPLKEVKRQAKAVLGQDLEHYIQAAEDSASVIERGAELTFHPQMDGVEFNPPHSSFQWVEAVHREEFRLRAARSLDGQRARGRLSVFIGNLLVADVNLTMRVDSGDLGDAAAAGLRPESARPYRKIFASYSHRDDAIVRHMGMLVQSLGDEFVRDCSHLRAGELWTDRLEDLIRRADVFQLFWSTNSMASEFVRHEWEYALSLGRPFFVRPCYWEEPMPARPEENLPPESLQRLHFQQLAFLPSRVATTPPQVPTPATARPSSAEPKAVVLSPSRPARSGDLDEALNSTKSVPPPPPSKPRPRWMAALAAMGSVAVLVAVLAVALGRTSNTYPQAAAPAPASPTSPPAGDPYMIFYDDVPQIAEKAPAIVPLVDACAARDQDACLKVFGELAAGCESGDMEACDLLYMVTPVTSDYEEYGATCGYRDNGENAGECDLAYE